MQDVIRSYMVGLGVQVDRNSTRQVQSALKSIDALINKNVSGITAAILKGTTAWIAAATTAASAIVGIFDHLADADMEAQKFAMKMFMAKDAAFQMKTVADAMGESLDDIAWMPELQERYQKLVAQAKTMEPPPDQAAQLKKIRDVKFEFTRLKVEATYGLQWVGNYLFKYLEGPIFGAKGGFKSFNDYLTKTMPVWTEKIAAWISSGVKVIQSLWRAIKDGIAFVEPLWNKLTDAFMGFFNKLPTGEKAILAIGGTLTAIFMATGPVGLAIAAIGGLLVLIDDFYAYIDGRESNNDLAPIWKWLMEAVDKVSDFITENGDEFQAIWDGVGTALQFVYDILKFVVKLIFTLVDVIIKSGTFKLIASLFVSIFDAVMAVFTAIGKLIKAVLGMDDATDPLEAWRKAFELVNVVLQLIIVSIKSVFDWIKIIAKALSGDFSGAWDDLNKKIKGDSEEMKGIFNNLAESLTGIKDGWDKTKNYVSGKWGSFKESVSTFVADVGAAVGVVSARPGVTTVKTATGDIIERKGVRNLRNNNPGNIEYGDFAKAHGAVGTDGRFAVFPNMEVGRAAKEALLFGNKYNKLNISGAIKKWAPYKNNKGEIENPHQAAYIAAATRAAGDEAGKPLWQYSPEARKRVMDAMKMTEGQGNVKETLIAKGSGFTPQGVSPGFVAPTAANQVSQSSSLATNVTINNYGTTDELLQKTKEQINQAFSKNNRKEAALANAFGGVNS